MATRNNDETNGCTFRWKIKNINLCMFKPFERIESPVFIANALEGTKWSLWLYPLGDTSENEFVSFYLYRENFNGPDVIEINYQLALLNKDGSFLKERTVRKGFRKKEDWGFQEFIERDQVFFTKKEASISEDTLTLQCTLWKHGEACAQLKHSQARTVFTVNRRSFVWKIDAFSTLKPGSKNRLTDGFNDFDLVLNEELDDLEKKIILNINSIDLRIKYFSFKISLIDLEGKRENCKMKEYFIDDLQDGPVSSMLIFSDKLMEHSNRYLLNDTLFLDCEYVFSIETHSCESFDFGTICSKSIGEVIESKKKHYVAQNMPNLIADLKSMYNDSIFNDTELRTSTQTFPAHKGILSARSPVFRRMFSNDMKENSGHVEITDLEDDTVHRMLTYVYTDSLENLQFDSAFKLFEAADKYQILSLKIRCSSFMKENLIPAKACELLILADQHQDVDLKCFVQDYILEHDKEVFGSQEWKDFMDTNLKLAADIMYKKVYPV